jgi:sarcosine oxidase delta subunit
MIVICLLPLLWFFLSFSDLDAEQRICEPVPLESLDWEEFKWLYKQQDSTFSGDSVANYVFIRINPDGTHEAREVAELHRPWTELLAAEIDSFELKRDSIIKRIHTPYRLRYTSTTRNKKQQLALQKRGFSKAFISFHNFGLAADGAISRKGKHLRHGAIYDQYGSKAKEIGLYWGGDFVGFPDPGHIQAFSNSANLIQKYPEVALEYEPFKTAYERNYFKKVDIGREELVEDSRDLLNELNKLRVNKPCACSSAIPFPSSAKDLTLKPYTITVLVNLHEHYIFIQKGSYGYFYSTGRWKLR